MGQLRRLERLVRSSVLATPFTVTNLLTHYDVLGRDKLLAALERRRDRGAGLITISNHVSLFDDPLVLQALLDIKAFSVESKCWWSTPCASNFSPRGNGLGARFVRYFSDVSNMVFFARPAKNGYIEQPSEYLPLLCRRGGSELAERLETWASTTGGDCESCLERYVTPGEPEHVAPLNQVGMIEACARVETGDWLHFFPEGTRSRTLSLRKPRRGVGKVLYHCRGAEVIPICIYGTQDVLPVGHAVPRALQKVVVTVGDPVPSERLEPLRREPPSPETFQALSEAAWQSVVQLRPATLGRYLGPARALELLRTEAEAAVASEPVTAPKTFGTETSRPVQHVAHP